MTIRASFLTAGAVALPLGLAATAGQAASLVDIVGDTEQLSTFKDAIAAAGLEEKLAGEGPFTVFAPSNDAFEQLPQPILSKLLEESHQAELARLLEHHVIDGEVVAAKDVVGQQTEMETAAGDRLTVDGTGSIVLVIPTGMTVARAGDQVMVERRAAVAVAPQVEVAAGEQSAERTEVTEGSDMPASEHQQEVLATDPAAGTRQTAPESGMPATEHQEEVLASDPATGQTAPEGEADPARTASGSDMPASPHQEEVLASDAETDQTAPGAAETARAASESDLPATEHQQEALASEPERGEAAAGGESGTQAAAESGMPATEHQSEVLAEGESASEDGGELLRHGSVIVADIQADNGVIHVIDAVLVPEALQDTLEQLKDSGR